jgi:energy-coupling factor transporter transmembrane protein EcfT
VPDQRLRVVTALLGSVLIACMQSPSGLLGVLLMTVGLCTAATLQFSRWLPAVDFASASRRTLRVNILTLMLWLTLSWQVTPVGGLDWDPEGVQQALIITLRLNAIVLWCLLWLAQISPESLASALRALGLPLRLTLLFYLSVRSLEGLLFGRARMQRAMRARAYPLKWRRRLRVTAQLLVLMMVEALRRADSFAAALRVRGLDLQTGGVVLARTSWRRVAWRDVGALTGLFVLMVVLGWGQL